MRFSRKIGFAILFVSWYVAIYGVLAVILNVMFVAARVCYEQHYPLEGTVFEHMKFRDWP